MAHQAHAIPWNLLASNLHWKEQNRCRNDSSNLHLRGKPDQAKHITFFAEAFARNVREHARCERAKFPDHYDALRPNDVVLGDDSARRILATVDKVRRFNGSSVYAPNGSIWNNSVTKNPPRPSVFGEWPIPKAKRTAAAFLMPYLGNDCYQFLAENGDAFFNLEMFKALLLHGEMDVVMRICAQPGHDLKDWFSQCECQCGPSEVGWNLILSPALSAYLALNVTYCFPEMWDDASGRADDNDYRQTWYYQYMLRQCTVVNESSDLAAHPHRAFFGVHDDQFHTYPRLRDKRWSYLEKKATYGLGTDDYPYGLMPIDEFLVCERLVVYVPSAEDVADVRGMLRRKGLPAEMVLDIMEAADYMPKRRLKVANDPFHAENRDELASYLKYCWLLIVRCQVVAEAVGVPIPWKAMVANYIGLFWGCRNERISYSEFVESLMAEDAGWEYM